MDKKRTLLHLTGFCSPYTLQKGVTYHIFAFGDDERIQDVDLSVYDSDDNEVGEDHGRSNIAGVTIVPRQTGTYKFAVSAYQMSGQYGFYGVVIAQGL